MGVIDKIKNEIKEYRYVYIAVFLIFMTGVFLRTYNLDSWMHFELDQSRDIFIINDAIENGMSKLPLLGPQARGKELYLGPIFYYFSYISSLILGVSPEAMVIPDLFFSIFSILLFYFFARIFFSRWISVALMSVVATSLFLITYGRFAWNPNGMFFWSLVTFYSLLKTYQNREFNSKWFLLFSFGFGVLTQLHFIAFIATPLIVLFYLIIARVRIPYKSVMWALLILTFLYSPVIFSEIKSGGKNINSFFLATSLSNGAETLDDREDGANRGFIEKTLRAFQESGTFYWNIMSSDNNGGYNIRVKKDKQAYLRIVCSENCKKALPHHLVALFIFLVSLVFFAQKLIKFFYRKNNLDSKDLRNEYLLVFLWLLFGEIFLILVAYQISPRFFLFLATPFFILLGVLLEKVREVNRWGKYVFGSFVILLVGANLYAIINYFDILSEAQTTKNTITWNDVIMNRNDIITLGQLRKAGLQISSQGDSKNFVIIGDNRYARAFYYIVALEGNNKNVLCYVKFADFDKEQMKGVTYYVLSRSKSENQINQSMLSSHHKEAEYSFGTINLYKMVPNEYINKTILPSQCFNR